jgi:hypothetical protein
VFSFVLNALYDVPVVFFFGADDISSRQSFATSKSEIPFFDKFVFATSNDFSHDLKIAHYFTRSTN